MVNSCRFWQFYAFCLVTKAPSMEWGHKAIPAKVQLYHCHKRSVKILVRQGILMHEGVVYHLTFTSHALCWKQLSSSIVVSTCCVLSVVCYKAAAILQDLGVKEAVPFCCWVRHLTFMSQAKFCRRVTAKLSLTWPAHCDILKWFKLYPWHGSLLGLSHGQRTRLKKEQRIIWAPGDLAKWDTVAVCWFFGVLSSILWKYCHTAAWLPMMVLVHLSN